MKVNPSTLVRLISLAFPRLGKLTRESVHQCLGVLPTDPYIKTAKGWRQYGEDKEALECRSLDEVITHLENLGNLKRVGVSIYRKAYQRHTATTAGQTTATASPKFFIFLIPSQSSK